MNFLTTLYLNSDGDVDFDDVYRLRMTEGEDKVAQDLIVLLKTQKGSDYFNTLFGFDKMTVIERPTEEVIKSYVIDALQQYQFIKAIESVEVDRNTTSRVATITIRLTVTDEPIEVRLVV